MQMGLGISLSRRRQGTGAAFSASIGGGAFNTGTLLTCTVGGLVGGEVVTYQWQDDGVNTGGATSQTYTAAIGTDGIADASQIRCVVTVDGGDPIFSGAREIRYPAGSVTETGLANWTIDDTVLNIGLVGDFSVPNLTGSYVIAGLPTGAVDDGDGTISGTPTGTPATTGFSATFTDQYGRQVVGNYSATTVYRSQATAGASPDLAFAEDAAITPYDFSANFTVNGNTLTYAAIDTLPTGLSLASNGTMSGTPTDITADANYTIRATDEYGRTTDLEAAIEITSGVAAPVAAGALADKEFTTNVAVPPYDTSVDFTGSGITYALAPTSDALPTGLVLSSSGVITGTPTVAVTRNIVVRGTNAGGTADSAFTLATVALAVTDNGNGTYSLTYGADTPDNFTVTIDGTPYTQDLSSNALNAALLDSVPAGQGLALAVPTISLSTDTGTAGELDSGDVAQVDAEGVWLYPSGQAAPTLTKTWRDQAGEIQANNADYTGDGSETTSIFARETDGTTTIESGTIPVAPPVASSVSRVVRPNVTGNAASTTLTATVTGFNAANGSRVIGLVAFKRSTGSGSPTFDLTFDGSAPTQELVSGNSRMRVFAFEAPHPGTGDVDVVVTRTSGSGNINQFVVTAVEIDNVDTVTLADPGAAGDATSISFDRNTVDGSYFLAGVTQDNNDQWASSGFDTDLFDALIHNNEWTMISEDEIATGASPQSFSMSRGATVGDSLAAASIYVEPA